MEISHKNEIAHKVKIIEVRKNKENVLIKIPSSDDNNNQSYEHDGHEPVDVCKSIDRTKPYPDSEAIKHSIEELNCEIKKKTKKFDSSLHALAIMLPGSPYAEDKERRLRTRYAVVSALAENNYVPNDPEHIDFVDFDKTCKAALRELRADKLAETEKNLFADKIKIIEEKTRFCHMGAFMPYEWFKHQDNDNKTILILWLNNSGFSSSSAQTPLNMLGFLKQKLDIKNPENHFSIIGPPQSGTLNDMYREITDINRPYGFNTFIIDSKEYIKCTSNSNCFYNELKDISIYTATATATIKYEDLNKEIQNDTASRENAKWLESKIVRTISTQDKLVDTLLCELALRGVTPSLRSESDRHCKGDLSEEFVPQKPNHPHHIVLIGEIDSFYSQRLTDTFRDKINHPQIHIFNYLRGLDGIVPEHASSAQKENENRNKESQANKPTSKEIKELRERPVGHSQLDYLLNLAERMEQLRKRLASEGGIGAIGITGSDTYDKLLILQALRKKFPGVPFFTTDLDARLFHPTEIKWTRNLLVASPFGLQLNESIQKHTPPFRDSYQTSIFLTTQFVLCKYGNTQSSHCTDLNEGTRKSWIDAPRLFEIGNYGAVDLSHENNVIMTPRLMDIKYHKSIPPISRIIYILFNTFLAAAIILILTFIFESFAPKDLHIKLTAIASTSILFILCYLWIDTSSNPGGEPISFTNGISSWPADGVRIIASLFICYFFLRIHNQLKDNERKIVESFSLLKKREEVENKTPIDKFMNIDHWKIQSLYVKETWLQYLELKKPVYSFARVILPFLLSFIIIVCVFLPIAIEANLIPLAPFRGKTNHDWGFAILILTVSLYLALILYIADTVHLSGHFIKLLADHNLIWPENLVKTYKNKYDLPEVAIKNKILLDFINQHTDAPNKFIYYPFVPLFLIIISRNHYFDNWSTTPLILFIYGIFASVTLISAIRLRAAALHAKDQILKNLNNTLPGAPVNTVWHRESNNSTKLKSFINEIKEFKEFKEGIYRPLAHHPMILNLLVPFSSIGGIYLIEYLT